MAPTKPTYRITGGNRLRGRVRIGGSKNGADYAIAAALLTAEDVVLHNVPDIGDVRQMEEILQYLGATVEHPSTSSLRINCANVTKSDVPASLAAQLRASFLVMGPLLARTGRASCPSPGGDVIGSRPLDVHLAGFRMLGATVQQHGDVFDVLKEGSLRAGRVMLDYPSVMGTLNVVLAATLSEGTTTIVNAASEPEISSLASMLNAMGAKIAGAGSQIVRIEGVRELHGAEHAVVTDRLEAGTFALAAAITRGEVELENAVPDRFRVVAGAGLARNQDGGPAGGHLADQVEHADHALALADDVGKAVALFEGPLEVGILVFEPPPRDHAVDLDDQLLVVPGLGEVVVGAELEGVDGGFHGAVSRDHEDGGLAVALAHFLRARPCRNGRASSGRAAPGRSRGYRACCRPSVPFWARSTA